MELYNVDEFSNHHGSERAVPESQKVSYHPDNAVIHTIKFLMLIYLENINNFWKVDDA